MRTLSVQPMRSMTCKRYSVIVRFGDWEKLKGVFETRGKVRGERGTLSAALEDVVDVVLDDAANEGHNFVVGGRL